MTRRFNQTVMCPHCQRLHTAESGFGRWMRNHPELKSGDGHVSSDLDYINHCYKIDHNRECQYLMYIEIKTHKSKLSESQEDTLYLVNQFMRNDKHTSGKRRKRHLDNRPDKAWSTLLKKNITVRAFGIHILTFENNSPDDSLWIKWDNTIINTDILLQLIKFEIHPDTLKPMDLRKHHKKQKTLPFNFSFSSPPI